MAIGQVLGLPRGQFGPPLAKAPLRAGQVHCEHPLALFSGLCFDCDITILPEDPREGSKCALGKSLRCFIPAGGRVDGWFGEGDMSGFVS